MPIDVGASFAIAVGPSSGSAPKQEVNDFDAIKIRYHLIDGDSVSFTVNGDGPAARYIDGYAADAWLYRAGALWQRFRLLSPTQDWDENGVDSVQVPGVCYKQVLNARFIHSLTTPASLVFTATEQGTIIQTLIAHTQAQTNGALGITYGTVNTSQPRDRTEYKIGDNIGNLIKDLTQVINGPTWRVSPGLSGDRELTVKLPSAFATIAQPAIHGVNVRKLRRAPGQQFANSGFAPGPSGTVGTTGLLGAWYDDVNIATDPRGRWEATRSPSSSVTDQAAVVQVAQGLVAEKVNPPATWVMDMVVARWLTDSPYLPGAFIKVKVPATTVDPVTLVETTTTKTAQVIETTLSVDKDGGTAVQVTAQEV